MEKYSFSEHCRIVFLRVPHLPSGSVLCRALAFSGAHVVFAVRNTKAAEDLVLQWQATLPAGKPPLRCEVSLHGHVGF